MTYTMRVSLAGYNALTDTNADHYALYADSDWVLIKEKARGSGTVSAYDSVDISHNLGYAPFYLVYGEIASGEYKLANSYDLYAQYWKTYSTTTDLTISNVSGSSKDYKYYIFYDQVA